MFDSGRPPAAGEHGTCIHGGGPCVARPRMGGRDFPMGTMAGAYFGASAAGAGGRYRQWPRPGGIRCGGIPCVGSPKRVHSYLSIVNTGHFPGILWPTAGIPPRARDRFSTLLAGCQGNGGRGTRGGAGDAFPRRFPRCLADSGVSGTRPLKNGLTAAPATLKSGLLGRDAQGNGAGGTAATSAELETVSQFVCFIWSLALTATLTTIFCAERMRA